MTAIDINSDLGESFGPWTMGADEQMMHYITSANVACGGHASDPETMYKTLLHARKNGVSVGAHPGYPDLMNFGRRVLPCSPDEIERFCVAQIGSLVAMAKLAGTHVSYVKPHGALNNVASDDQAIADAIARGVAAVGGLSMLATSGTELEHASRAQGLTTWSEIFADRAYTSRGRLVPRSHPQAMLTDPDAAAERLIGYFRTGLMPTIDGPAIPLAAQSICIHGDSPHAVPMARRLREVFAAEGIAVRAFEPV